MKVHEINGTLSLKQYMHYGSPVEAEKEKEAGNIFKDIMTKTFLSLQKEIDIQIQEAKGSRIG